MNKTELPRDLVSDICQGPFDGFREPPRRRNTIQKPVSPNEHDVGAELEVPLPESSPNSSQEVWMQAVESANKLVKKLEERLTRERQQSQKQLKSLEIEVGYLRDKLVKEKKLRVRDQRDLENARKSAKDLLSENQQMVLDLQDANSQEEKYQKTQDEMQKMQIVFSQKEQNLQAAEQRLFNSGVKNKQLTEKYEHALGSIEQLEYQNRCLNQAQTRSQTRIDGLSDQVTDLSLTISKLTAEMDVKENEITELKEKFNEASKKETFGRIELKRVTKRWMVAERKVSIAEEQLGYDIVEKPKELPASVEAEGANLVPVETGSDDQKLWEEIIDEI